VLEESAAEVRARLRAVRASAQTLEEGIATITKPSRGGSLQGGAHVTP